MSDQRPYVDEYVHACHLPLSDGTDAVVIKVHRHEGNQIKDELVVVPAPKRAFYLTKPGMRNHKLKKERESLQNLDRFLVYNHELETALDRELNGNRFHKRRPRLRQLCNSPYVYGADMHIEVLMKHKYQKDFAASQKKPTPITTGFTDTETDIVTGKGDEITMMSVTHENKVYTAFQRKFFTVKNPDGSFREGDFEEFKAFSKEILDHHIAQLVDDHVKKNPKSKLKQKVKENPFTYEYHLAESAADVISWCFKKVHENRTDFLGIWNIDFDCPKIIANLKAEDIDPSSVFCPPELPMKYRYAEYVRDNKETDSIFKKWHWMHTASYTQCVDSQNLYSILRTVKGKEISMKLDSILKLNDLGGKLTFKDATPDAEELSDADWHRYMQKNEAYKYIVYNQFDAISLQLLEWKNQDLASMLILGGISQLSKWTRQTRKVSDSFYFDALDEGYVTASPGETMETEYDRLLTNTGGAVLRPERTIGIGLKIFSDMPHIVTMLHNMSGDVDFSGMYPTVNDVCNVSKSTKISTALNIEGMSQEKTHTYYSQIISLEENAVAIGKAYYGLPGYQDMQQRMMAHLGQR